MNRKNLNRSVSKSEYSVLLKKPSKEVQEKYKALYDMDYEETSRGLNPIYYSEKAINLDAVKKLTGLSKKSILEKLNSTSPEFDNKFPRPFFDGKVIVGWIKSQLIDYLENLKSNENTVKAVN